MENHGPRVYSYLRFSDPKQAGGSSIERQTEYARRWSAEHGVPLDDALTMRDEGLSAYHQKHIKQGALGVFMAAIDAGRIAPGSVLIVEGLDRLSRAEPILAQAQLAQIVNAGISVVTASDSREYNRESLKAQPMDLVYSLLVMIRAHEESDTKSKRVRAAIERQCQGWQSGHYRGLIRNGKDPHWLAWHGDHWEIVPERAQAVRRALQLFGNGYGAVEIVRRLTQEGLQLTELKSRAGYIYKVLRQPALIGIKEIEVNGTAYRLEGYYPALLSVDEFMEIGHLADQRHVRKGKGEIPSIITGTGITVCGYCGAAIAATNYMQRNRLANGNPQEGHRRILCSGYRSNGGCMGGYSNSVGPIERALVAWCADQMNIDSLFSGSSHAAQLRSELARHKLAYTETERQLARLTDALLADAETTPLVFVRRARELENQLAQQHKAIEALERELAQQHTPASAAQAAAWQQLAYAATEDLDTTARMTLRKLTRDTFSRLVIYLRGTDPHKDSPHLDLLLVARGGGTRMLRIHRRTGELLAGEDVAV